MARMLGKTAHAVGKGNKVVGGGDGLAGGKGGAKGGADAAAAAAASAHVPHMLPAHVARARLPPNVIVAHQEEGIEVLHLYTGRTLCKMLLPPPGLHADVNGDGVVDHVQAHGSAGGDAGHAAVGADGGDVLSTPPPPPT